jgi:hypothetical protein
VLAAIVLGAAELLVGAEATQMVPTDVAVGEVTLLRPEREREGELGGELDSSSSGYRERWRAGNDDGLDRRIYASGLASYFLFARTSRESLRSSPMSWFRIARISSMVTRRTETTPSAI